MFKKILVHYGAVEFIKRLVMSGSMVAAGALTYGVVNKISGGNANIEPKYLMLSLTGVESVVFYVSWKMFYGVPFTFRAFSARALLSLMEDQYFILTQLRVFDRFGFKFQHGVCDNLSYSQRSKQLQRIKHNNKIIKAFEGKVKPGTQDYIGYLTVKEYFGTLEEAYDFGAWPSPLFFINPTIYPVNQLFGNHIALIDILLRQPISNLSELKEYINRVIGSKQYITDILEELYDRESKLSIPPAYIIESALSQISNKVLAKSNGADQQYFLCKKFKDDMVALKLSDRDQDYYLQKLNDAIDQYLIPSFERLQKYLIPLKDKTIEGDGIWRLPNGDNLYNFLLRWHTTTDLTAEEIHEIGQKEIKRLKSEIIELFKDEYPQIQDNFSHTLRSISKEERFQLGPSDDPKTKDKIIQEYKNIIEDVAKKLPEFFEKIPLAKCSVEPVPSYKENEAPPAYYFPSPLDRSKPAVFYANLRDTTAHNRLIMKDLCYHEAIPGHHFQVSLSQEESSIDLFRRNLIFTSYTEGWGLYCERLASEIGFYNDKYEKLGHLVAEMWRSLRLVIDTGIHSSKYKWTREQSVQLMTDNTYLVESDIKSEIDRYIVMPGQAVSYYIGLLKFIELRELAKSKLTSNFSIKEFHSVVLNSGAIPLKVLTINVNNWIDLKLSSSSSSSIKKDQ